MAYTVWYSKNIDLKCKEEKKLSSIQRPKMSKNGADADIYMAKK